MAVSLADAPRTSSHHPTGAGRFGGEGEILGERNGILELGKGLGIFGKGCRDPVGGAASPPNSAAPESFWDFGFYQFQVRLTRRPINLLLLDIPLIAQRAPSADENRPIHVYWAAGARCAPPAR